MEGSLRLVGEPADVVDRLKEVLLLETFILDGTDYKLSQCALDPCIFCLSSNLDVRPAAYLAIHVDDLLIVVPPETNRHLQNQIGKLFPVDGWEEASSTTLVRM